MSVYWYICESIKEILNSVRNKVARNLNVKRGELKQDWEETLVRDVFRMMDKSVC